MAEKGELIYIFIELKKKTTKTANSNLCLQTAKHLCRRAAYNHLSRNTPPVQPRAQHAY